MKIPNKKDYPKEITINLEEYKADKDVDLKCFIAHDYIEFDTHTYIKDINDNGYWIKQDFQININVMAMLLEKLKTCPHLQKEHYNHKGYLYRDNIIFFEEWHLDKKDEAKRRSEFLVREQDDEEWVAIPKKLWDKKKFDILKGLK